MHLLVVQIRLSLFAFFRIKGKKMSSFSKENARFNMIEQQIRPCEVIDSRVLDTLKNTPREFFVEEEYQELAFADIHIPLKGENVMMKPMQEGIMLQALDVQPNDKVLEIGSGSGFITACLLSLGGEVTSFEINSEQSKIAESNLKKAGFDQANLIIGDIFEAKLEEETFDVIALTASIHNYDKKFISLLKKGGRFFFIHGEKPVMSASVISKGDDGEIIKKDICETLLPPLRNEPLEKVFKF